jgi:diguanylate cyclase (GGDEF)-like protein
MRAVLHPAGAEEPRTGEELQRAGRRAVLAALVLSGVLLLTSLATTGAASAGLLLRLSVWGAFVLSIPVSVLAAQTCWRARRIVAGEGARDGVTDDLTGLPNRSGLICELDRWRMESGDATRRAWLVNVSLLNLNKLNHEYGYAAGDLAIKDVAALLRANLEDRYTVGRIGPEEFMVILPDGNEDEARSLVASLEKAIDTYKKNSARRKSTSSLKAAVSCAPYRPEVESLHETMKTARESTLAWEFSGTIAQGEGCYHVPRITLGAFAVRRWDALSDEERRSYDQWTLGAEDGFTLQMASEMVQLLDERAEGARFDFVTSPPASKSHTARLLARRVAECLGVPYRNIFRGATAGPDDRTVEPSLDAVVEQGQSALLVSDFVRSGILERKCVRQLSGRGVNVLSLSWAAQ